MKHHIFPKSTFWKYIPFRRYLIFISAIFFLFSGTGFIIDLLSGGSYSELLLFINVGYSGIVAVFYVYSFTRNLKFLPFTIFFQIVAGINIWQETNQLPLTEFPQRASFDAIGILVTMVLGYILLIIFINTEGIRNLRLHAEMNLARDLHSHLVPKIEMCNNHFEIFGISNPTDEVGGDLIDYFENTTSLTCYIADVSGHGVAAGSLMGMIKSTIRVLLNKDEPLRSMLSETSKTIYNVKKKNMFLTCAFLKFNTDYTVEYSTAGHLPILKVSSDSNHCDELIIKQLPVAAIQDIKYTTNRAAYNKNDLFILLTDGITETTDKQNEDFGIEKVKQIILNSRNDELPHIYNKLNNKIASYGKQKDDQTILFVRCL